MSVTWGSRWGMFWTNSKLLKTGWLSAALIVAFYVGAIRPAQQARLIANTKATGLSAGPVSVDMSRAWRQTRIGSFMERDRVAGIIGGVPGEMQAATFSADKLASPPPPPVADAAAADRKMVRTSFLDMVVQHPAEAAEKIRTLAESLGGFLVSSEVRGGQNATGGSLTIRVPAARSEEVRAEIRKLGLRIESEKVEAQDVTRQYVDQKASLRNLRAEETQYLAILKQAKTVKDTLEVSEKLSDVRGQIEQQQAEFEVLSKQIVTVAIAVTMRAEAETQVFGLSWRPLYQMKMAFRDGLDGVADYASSMTAILFYLPAVVLWLGTILLGAAVGWRVVRWVGRRVFGWGTVKSTEAVV
ncbi:MAG: hypothetical protein DMG77_18410 [Acidobacteria bacterium]|nr:MAG: hypothetical protein DMG77_18410 [Acidobacteriota bacterium]